MLFTLGGFRLIAIVVNSVGHYTYCGLYAYCWFIMLCIAFDLMLYLGSLVLYRIAVYDYLCFACCAGAVMFAFMGVLV